MSPVPSCLLGRWVHSWEEDSADIRIYRQADSQLPLSRMPRHVLEFEADQHVVSRVGGPADARIARAGRWHVEAGEPMRLGIDWLDASQPTLVEVVTCSDELLQIRVVSGSIE